MAVFTFANGDSASAIRTKLINKLSPVIDVKADFGAAGDNSTNDTAAIQAALDAAYGGGGQTVPNFATNRPVFFPPGTYKITSPLTITNTNGAWIFGAGRHTTTIRNTSSGSVFVTNGFSYGVVEKMRLEAGASGHCFDWDYDGSGNLGNQSVTWNDMYFVGGLTGLRVGAQVSGSNAQGSEGLVNNCYFINCTEAGLSTVNANALQITVNGGNFGSCAIGIHCGTGIAGSGTGTGSVPAITGVGFQNGAGWDIVTENNSNDSMAIKGCRSETDNFFWNGGGHFFVVEACSQTQSGTGGGTGSGFFVKTNGGDGKIIGCRSTFGQVNPRAWSSMTVENSDFGRSDWLTTTGFGSPNRSASLRVMGVHFGGADAVGGWGGLINHQVSNARNIGFETTDITSPAYVSTGCVVTANAGNDQLTFAQVHGLAVDAAIAFQNSGGGLPAGLSANTTYFVKTVPGTTTITVAATVGGSTIDITTAGTGTHSAYIPMLFFAGDRITKSNAASGGNPGWLCTTGGYNTTGGAAVFKAEANLA